MIREGERVKGNRVQFKLDIGILDGGPNRYHYRCDLLAGGSYGESDFSQREASGLGMPRSVVGAYWTVVRIVRGISRGVHPVSGETSNLWVGRVSWLGVAQEMDGWVLRVAGVCPLLRAFGSNPGRRSWFCKSRPELGCSSTRANGGDGRGGIGRGVDGWKSVVPEPGLPAQRVF